MIIVKLQGGLGNQMFQYAFGKYLSEKHNTQLKLDLHDLLDRTKKSEHHVFRDYDLDIFNLEAQFASGEEVRKLTRWTNNTLLNKACNRLFGKKKTNIVEPHTHFSQTIFQSPANVYLEGYWQSEKYFKPIEQQIRQCFQVKEELSSQAKDLLGTIQATNSVCVNIRRGDFVVNKYHSVCDEQYYIAAEKIMCSKVQNPHFYVFSDEIEWCMENLKFSVPVTFVTHQYAGKKFQDYFRLMSACKHFIIPNSSFAWWATWMNDNKEKVVVAPKKWVSDETKKFDIHLDNWITIE